MDESNYWIEGDDAKFTQWINNSTQNYQLFDDAITAIYRDESLSEEERKSKLRQVAKDFGEKLKRKDIKPKTK